MTKLSKQKKLNLTKKLENKEIPVLKLLGKKISITEL